MAAVTKFHSTQHDVQKDASKTNDLQISQRNRNSKSTTSIKSATRRILITKMKNEKSDIITSRKGIADVFGEFYSKLYDDDQGEDSRQIFNEVIKQKEYTQ